MREYNSSSKLYLGKVGGNSLNHFLQVICKSWTVGRCVFEVPNNYVSRVVLVGAIVASNQKNL